MKRPPSPLDKHARGAGARKPAPGSAVHAPPSSFSLLRSLPEDQIQLVLSYSYLSDLLSLSAASRALRAAAASTHYLLMPLAESDRRDREAEGGACGGILSSPPRPPADSIFVGGAARSPTSLGVDGLLGGGGDRQGPSRRVGERPVRARGEADVDAVTFPPSGGPSSLLFRATDPAAAGFLPDGGTSAASAMSESRILTLLGRFRTLRVLTLRGLSGLGDSFLPVLNNSDAAPSLVSLGLHDVRIVRDRHRLDLKKNGDRLVQITVTGTLFVSYGAVLVHFSGSRNLRSVVLGGCRYLADVGVVDITRRLSSTLEELCLPGCSRIVSPTIKSDSLHKLELQRCTQLQSLPGICCPSLVVLDLSFDTALVDVAVNSVVSNCPNLQRLVLKGCSRLLAPSIHSRSLEFLDISLCNQLNSIDINCGNLNHLEVGMCMCLQSMNLILERLSILNLSMLPLGTLILSAPSLTELNLGGCFALSDSGLHCDCPRLESLDVCGTSLTDISLEAFRSPSSASMTPVTIHEGGQPPLDWNRLGPQ